MRNFTPDNPRVSAIVVSYNARNTIEQCLHSLKNQATGEQFEVIVVDSSNDGTADLVQQGFPTVRLLRFAGRKYPGDARNIGIRASRSEIIAFLDADCRAAANWIDEILNAHRRPHLGIGGAVANGEPAGCIGWAAYLCEFSQWMPAAQAKWLTDIPTANMSYKKIVFDSIGPFIERTYCADTDLHWRLARAGHLLRWEPSLLVWHTSINRFGEFLRHEFHHGCSFARVRVRARSFTKTRRLLYTLSFPMIALKLLGAISFRALRSRDASLPFAKAFPVLALGVLSWSMGECAGYFRPGTGGHE